MYKNNNIVLKSNLILIIITFIVTIFNAQAASAKTYIEYIQSKCPNSNQITPMYNLWHAAYAINSKEQYNLSEKLSQQYFYCSSKTKDKYARDMALEFYAQFIPISYNPIEVSAEKRYSKDLLAFNILKNITLETNFHDIREIANHNLVEIQKTLDEDRDALK